MTEPPRSRSVELARPSTTAAAYFLLTFAWSVGFWSLSVLQGGMSQPWGALAFYFGGAGPLVAALVLVHGFESAPVRRDFWRRTVDPRVMPARWLLVALAIHPLVVLVAQLGELALGGAPALRPAIELGPGALVALIGSVFVLGPLPEEMGWRGVALDRLQVRMTALGASLVLGAAWAAWHVPLFLIDGTFQHGLGFASLRFWIFMADLLPLTVIITWIYNHARRSVLAAVLVHFTGNLCGAFLDKSDRLAALELAGLVLVATVLVAREGRALGFRAGQAEAR